MKVIRYENGAKTFEMVPPSKLENGDISQVFGKTGLRDEADQNQWLHQRRPAQIQATVERPPYTVANGYLVVERPVRICKRDLQRILDSL